MQDPWANTPHEVLLLNFGGPTKADDVEPFLRRLFEDPFIIRTRMPQGLRRWLARYIARRRAPRIAEEYAKIGFSPINRTTQLQAEQLERLLREQRPQTRVRVVNRYMPPFIEDVLGEIDPKKARVFILTLYPHLCHSTVVSSLRDVDLAWRARHGEAPLPSTRVFSWWWSPSYLAYSWARLEQTLQKTLREAGDAPVSVVFSAHGIPQRYNERGDPYVTETQTHFADHVHRGREMLARFEGGRYAGQVFWDLSFQSRVGPVTWVRPYTDELIEARGKERGGILLTVPVSFTSDHIETLFEMDVTYQKLALESGFARYVRVAPANDDMEFTRCLKEVLAAHGFFAKTS